MSSTTNRPSAPAAASDHHVKSAPDGNAMGDESIKRLSETQVATDEPVKRPPDSDAGPDERIKRLPSDTELFLALAPEVQALLGPPPLIPGEDRGAYTNLLLAVAQAVQPKEFTEWLAVQDIADCAWNYQRLKRLQTNLLAKEVEAGLRDHLLQTFRAAGHDAAKSQELAAAAMEAYLAPDQERLAKSRKALRGKPVDLDTITAQALVKVLERYGTLEQMITTAARRRVSVQRDLERRRSALVRRRRLEQIIFAPSPAFGGSRWR